MEQYFPTKNSECLFKTSWKYFGLQIEVVFPILSNPTRRQPFKLVISGYFKFGFVILAKLDKDFQT